MWKYQKILQYNFYVILPSPIHIFYISVTSHVLADVFNKSKFTYAMTNYCIITPLIVPLVLVLLEYLPWSGRNKQRSNNWLSSVPTVQTKKGTVPPTVLRIMTKFLWFESNYRLDKTNTFSWETFQLKSDNITFKAALCSKAHES